MLGSDPGRDSILESPGNLTSSWMKGREGGITNNDAVIGFQRTTLGWDNVVYTVGHQTRLDWFEDMQMNGQLSIIIPSLLHMNVHSYDCDNFTKEFYHINFTYSGGSAPTTGSETGQYSYQLYCG